MERTFKTVGFLWRPERTRITLPILEATVNIRHNSPLLVNRIPDLPTSRFIGHDEWNRLWKTSLGWSFETQVVTRKATLQASWEALQAADEAHRYIQIWHEKKGPHPEGWYAAKYVGFWKDPKEPKEAPKKPRIIYQGDESKLVWWLTPMSTKWEIDTEGAGW